MEKQKLFNQCFKTFPLAYAFSQKVHQKIHLRITAIGSIIIINIIIISMNIPVLILFNVFIILDVWGLQNLGHSVCFYINIYLNFY